MVSRVSVEARSEKKRVKFQHGDPTSLAILTRLQSVQLSEHDRTIQPSVPSGQEEQLPSRRERERSLALWRPEHGFSIAS